MLGIRNNLYAMLGQTNLAVSQSESAESLYRVVCEIAVNIGKFQCAWVGVPAGNESVRSTLLPLAKSLRSLPTASPMGRSQCAVPECSGTSQASLCASTAEDCWWYTSGTKTLHRYSHACVAWFRHSGSRSGTETVERVGLNVYVPNQLLQVTASRRAGWPHLSSNVRLSNKAVAASRQEELVSRGRRGRRKSRVSRQAVTVGCHRVGSRCGGSATPNQTQHLTAGSVWFSSLLAFSVRGRVPRRQVSVSDYDAVGGSSTLRRFSSNTLHRQ
jgi:hypothetical protein